MLKRILLLLVLVNVFLKVEGKYVRKRIKKSVSPGSSYSLIPQPDTQWVAREQEADKNVYWYKSSAIGENNQFYGAKSNPNRHSNANYDIESYENLNQLLDSEFASQDLKHDQHHEAKLDSEKYDDPLESDQVFLHHEKENSKYIHNKVETNPPENYLIIHSKSDKRNNPSSIGVIDPEMDTKLNEGNFQPVLNPTQLPTLPSTFETELSSDKLSFDSDFGFSQSELIQGSKENLEFKGRNLPTEKESDALTVLKDKDLQSKDKTVVREKDNFASNLQENRLSGKNVDSVMSLEDKNLFKIGINQMFEDNFDSFVFNPSAQALEKFQECTTPRNESGFCRYVQHCMIPNILNSIQHFMENVCIIQGRFIGVCCPEFPVQTVLVKWDNQPESFNDRNDSVEIPQDCGIGTNTRIVGGTDADRKAWLWMVALLNDKKKFFCGGSLINSRYVLTAAHCTFGTSKNRIIARLGEYDFNDPREPHDDYRVVEIKRHLQYNSLNLRNDIALLKLEKPVVFNEFVQTICFPEAANDYVGNVSTLVGWGHLNGDGGGTSDVLQVASFPVISNDQCSTTHRIPIPSSLICAAAVSRDKGACNGDSGGPLMLLDENNRWKVIGIVSWGRRGCNPKFPTVYTRVTHFMDWIRQHST